MRRTLAKRGGRRSHKRQRGGRKTRRFRGGRSRRFSRRFRGRGGGSTKGIEILNAVLDKGWFQTTIKAGVDSAAVSTAIINATKECGTSPGTCQELLREVMTLLKKQKEKEKEAAEGAAPPSS